MNVHNESTYNTLALVHLLLFKLIGILPYVEDDEPNDLRRALKNFLSAGCCHITSFLYYTMHIVYGLRMLLERRLEIDYICDVMIVQGICLRYLVLYLQRWDLLELTDNCRELWSLFVKNEEVQIVNKFEKKVYFLRHFFFWNTLLAVTFYVMTAQFVRIPPMEVNGTSTRILPIKFYVDVQEEPWYTLVSVIQAIVCCGIAVILTGIETVGPFLIMMSCGYLNIVHDRLEVIAFENASDMLPTNEVLACVKFHQKTLQFCERIGSFTRRLFMVQLAFPLYNMSLIGISLLQSNDSTLKSSTILVMNLVQFFSCQWIAQHLLDESQAITEAAYQATLMHRRFDLKTNRMMFLMMLRSQKPVQLTAGGYIRLSLESFQKLIVNAFSFFTLLRNFVS